MIRGCCFHVILFLLTTLALPDVVRSQVNFEDTNLALRYLPDSNIPIEYEVIRTDSSYLIYFTIEIDRDINFKETYSLTYETKSSFTSKRSILSKTLTEYLHGIGSIKNKKYFRFEIPSDEDHQVLFINLKNKNSGISFIKEIPLRGNLVHPYPGFYLENPEIGLPVCKPFITVADSLVIRSMNDRDQSFTVYHYDHEFTPADPPMYRIKKNVSPSLNVDTSFMIKADVKFHLSEKGLYFIQADTTSVVGIGFRVEELLYPKLVKIEDLAGPLVYLTTRQEYSRLTGRGDQRKEFEKFWLNLSRSEDQARWVIKKYFDKVEQANQYFTNYKPGWKNDMGMIFIIFGPPQEVYSNGETESWYYRNEAYSQTVVFNFVRLRNIFSEHHYMLVRDKEYKNVWLRSIDEWRKAR